jgi:hypothetical protein
VETNSPIVTDCAAAIDQIIQRKPAKLTFHRHRPAPAHDLLEEDGQRLIEALKVAATRATSG